MAENAPNFVEITGPLLIGYLINFFLFGVFCVQVYIYYISFPNDRVLSQVVVYALLVIETVQVLLNTVDVFDMFARGFGNHDNLDLIHFSWFAVPIMTGLVSCIVQCFYSHRIYLLTEWRVVPLFITLLSLTQFTAAFVGGVQVFIAGRFSHIESARTASTIWLSGSAACDVLIALCMTYHLLRADSGFRSTRIVLTKIIRLVVETGTITAVVAVLDVILFLGFPHATFHTVPAQSLAKLYSNALLVLFNSRVKVRGGREEKHNPNESDPSEIDLGASGGSLGFQFANSIKLNDTQDTAKSERRTRIRRHRSQSWSGDLESMHSTRSQSNADETLSSRRESDMIKGKAFPLSN